MRFSLHKSSFCWAALLLAGALLALSGPRPGDPIIEKGPYTPVYPSYFGNRIFIPAGNPLTKEGIYLGRLLFYEPMLSANNKISCASCHQQKKAFTDGRAFSTGIDQTPTSRNAMTLANLLWVKDFFWDGGLRPGRTGHHTAYSPS